MTEIISPDNQLVDDSGISTQRTQIWLDQVTDLQIITGTGTPEGIVSANVSRLYLQTDGTDGAVLFIKQLSDIGGDPKYGWVVCGGGGSASIALEDLTDVTITSVATGELLKWNGSAWVNNTLSEAGVQPEEDQRLSTTDSVEFLSVTTGNVIATGNITVTGTVDGRDIAVDGIKLDGIEAGADVTDTANVTAAGALMDSEVVNLDQVKNFDSADYATAAQGVTADNALPLSGGTMTGVIANFQSTGIDDNATSTALTIDSSQNATFANDVTIAGNEITFTSGITNYIQVTNASDQTLSFRNYGAGNLNTTFDGSATFAGDVHAGNITSNYATIAAGTSYATSQFYNNFHAKASGGTGTDYGSYWGSIDDDNTLITSGGFYNTAGKWYSRGTTWTGIRMIGGATQFFGNTGLTNGTATVPTQLAEISTTGATFAGEIDASAGGIYLGGTAAANHLDDYEEGTWTPTNYTGSALNAKYIKIGNLVTVSVYLYGGTFTTINIGGLPFSPSTSNRYVSGTVGFTDTTNVTAIYAQTSSRLQFINKTTAVTPNNDRMMISCTYFVGI